MVELLLHENTKRQIGLITKSPPHALMICGQPGAGKTALAELIASLLLGIPADKLSQHPYYLLIKKPEKKQEIPIETVRETIKKLRLKPVLGSSDIKQVVVIENAHLMSDEAQNALLKAIEEPPPATVFIMSATAETAILPTIASRAQKIKLSSVDIPSAIAYFVPTYDEKTIRSAWELSGGAPGLLSALLSEDNQHRLKLAVEDAKKLIGMSRYDRVLFLDSISGDRGRLSELIEALARVLTALHRSSITQGKSANAKRLIAARRQVDEALQSLSTNASPKLIAMNLAINLPV